MARKIALWFGLLVCAVTVGAVLRAQVPILGPRTAVGTSIAAAAPGRFQIVINPTLRADTFLLDSETGKIWKPVAYSTLVGDPVVWELQDRVDSDAEATAWARQFRTKP